MNCKVHVEHAFSSPLCPKIKRQLPGHLGEICVAMEHSKAFSLKLMHKWKKKIPFIAMLVSVLQQFCCLSLSALCSEVGEISSLGDLFKWAAFHFFLSDSVVDFRSLTLFPYLSQTRSVCGYSQCTYPVNMFALRKTESDSILSIILLISLRLHEDWVCFCISQLMVFIMRKSLNICVAYLGYLALLKKRKYCPHRDFTMLLSISSKHYLADMKYCMFFFIINWT